MRFLAIEVLPHHFITASPTKLTSSHNYLQGKKFNILMKILWHKTHSTRLNSIAFNTFPKPFLLIHKQLHTEQSSGMHKPTLNKPQKEHCKVIRRNWVHFYKVFHIFWSLLLLQKKGQLHNRNLPIYSKFVQQSLMMLHTWSLFPAFRDSIVWRTFEPCTREWLEMRLSSRYPYPQTVASLQVSQGQRKSLLKQFCKYLLWQIQTGMKTQPRPQPPEVS